MAGSPARLVGPAVIVGTDISRRALQLLELYARRAGLRVVDALIAATALQRSVALATANVRHYRAITGLSVVGFRPGPSS